MGDITGITDINGNLVASYHYDPWGRVLDDELTAIGELNPFRYRSYYYDVETELYYLQSRYYDPEVGRFINSDDVSFIGATGSEISYNPFAYCENNPVNQLDDNGCLAVPWRVKVAILSGIAGAIYTAIKYWRDTTVKKSLSKSFIKGLSYALCKGFVKGAVVGLLSTVKGAIAWGVAGGTVTLIFGIVSKQVTNVSSAFNVFLNGWTCGVASCSFNKLTSKIFSLRIFKNLKSSDIGGYIIDLIGGFGVSWYLNW